MIISISINRATALAIALFAFVGAIGPSVVHAQFGASVALDGDRVIVGEPNFSRLLGEAAVIFDRNSGGQWVRSERLSNAPTTMGSYYGYFSAIVGDRAYVSSTVEKSVSIYQKIGETWEVHSIITPTAPLEEGSESWGSALAYGTDGSGDELVFVGQRLADVNTGAVFVYRWNGIGWDEEAVLRASDAEQNSVFGRSVAWSGTQLLVGASGKRVDGVARGAVYVFSDAGGGIWKENSIISPDRADMCNLGRSIALSGNHAIASATNPNCSGGSVFFLSFEPASGEWSISDDFSVENDPDIVQMEAGFAGAFLDIDGDLAAVPVRSTTGEEDLAIFERNPADNSWSKTRTILLDTDMNIRSVSLDGDRVVVGGIGFVEIHNRDAGSGDWTLDAKLYTDETPAAITGAEIPCIAGAADQFECREVALLSYFPNEQLYDPHVYSINDLWGWVDPDTEREYVLLGGFEQTVFVDVTDASNPVLVGLLPKTVGAFGSTWRDIKVYNDYAFIVSDGAGQHGMQVFDLTRLRNVLNPQVFAEDAVYDAFASAHNLAINEETGFAYIVGGRSGGETCGGAVHMVNIQDPLNPIFEGCFVDPATGRNGNGYTHDIQCVVYHGPDAAYVGREICFGSNVSALSVADVTDKQNPVAVSSASYPSVAYSHQGWITDDHRYFFLDDELDEGNFDINTRTLIWDIRDLDDPVLLSEYFGPSTATNHNLFIKGERAFLTNYAEGLRILDISDIANPVEIAFFDTVPHGDVTGFNGAWASYPYFPSGNIAVSSRYQGLFMLSPSSVALAVEEEQTPVVFQLAQNFPNPFNPTTTITFSLEQQADIELRVVDVLGREIRTLFAGVRPAGSHEIEFDAAGLPSGTYFYRLQVGDVTESRGMTLVK